MPLFCIALRTHEEHEAATLQPPEAAVAFFKWYTEAKAAGVVIGAYGILPSISGRHVSWADKGAEPVVTNGPFPPSETISGFWIINTETIDEALEWVKKFPSDHALPDSEIELRPLLDLDDVAKVYSSEQYEGVARIHSEHRAEVFGTAG